MRQEILLKQIKDEQKYWVVRAGKKGMYLNHFLENDLAAIGHLDEVAFSTNDLKTDDDEVAFWA